MFSSSQEGKHLPSYINLYCYGILSTVCASGHCTSKRRARETKTKGGQMHGRPAVQGEDLFSFFLTSVESLRSNLFSRINRGKEE